jgi:hypothetical protein
MHKQTAAEVRKYRTKKRAKSAKRSGGNWLPVAAAADKALQDMRELYKTILHMRALTYEMVDDGKAVTPAASEWDQVLDHIQGCADRLRMGLKGRG